MGKVIDISSKISNQKPVLRLTEDKVYTIDDSKDTVLVMNQKLANSNPNDLNVMDEIILMTLGEKAKAEIDAMKLGMSAYQSIFIAIMAGISGMEYEEAEQKFRQTSPKL